MVFNPQKISLENWRETLDKDSEKMELKGFVDKMLKLNLFNAVFVDCTASQAVADLYDTILNANISIVTPNKKANSCQYERYKSLKTIARKRGTKFLYGANVGAGLPIINTIDEMLRSGDKILKIEAILSGTLSYIFNTFVGNQSFSEIVQQAKEKGYTEPDPRDDLNGMDVARKLLILARESGYPLEMEQITIEKILPQEYFALKTVDEFLLKLKNYDPELQTLREQAQQQNQRLRYIARLDQGKATVSLQAVGIEHPFYHIAGSDNIIAITSEFYQENPLVIKGAGAGAHVTAGKVFADIIKLGLEHVSIS